MSNTCPQCQQPYDVGAVFCDNCGAKLPQLSAQAQAPLTPTIAPGGMTCPNCGLANVVGAMFCENCGASLSAPTPPSPPPAQSAPPPLPHMSFVTGRIVLQAGGTALVIPPGKAEIVIGREDPVSGVFPDIDLESHNGLDNGVGRKHAKLVTQGGQVYLEDLQSVNGTSLRGQKLQSGQRLPINNGDEFILGRLKCTYYTS